MAEEKRSVDRYRVVNQPRSEAHGAPNNTNEAQAVARRADSHGKSRRNHFAGPLATDVACCHTLQKVHLGTQAVWTEYLSDRARWIALGSTGTPASERRDEEDEEDEED